MSYNDVNEVVDEIFESLRSRYQGNLEKNIKKKKATINSKNKDDKCFQYAVTVTLNDKEIRCNPERFSHIKLFINKYKRKGIYCPSIIGDWKMF